YYTASLANEGDMWLVDGMRDLKTLRLEKQNATIDLSNAETLLRINHFEGHTYISLDDSMRHLFSTKESAPKRSYLIAANAKVSEYKKEAKTQSFVFDAHVDLKLRFYLEEGCSLLSQPQAQKITSTQGRTSLSYQNTTKSIVHVTCR
ncbi:MAG: hypothetical protein WBK95_11365, partial [Sulfurimonas sp.]